MGTAKSLGFNKVYINNSRQCTGLYYKNAITIAYWALRLKKSSSVNRNKQDKDNRNTLENRHTFPSSFFNKES